MSNEQNKQIEEPTLTLADLVERIEKLESENLSLKSDNTRLAEKVLANSVVNVPRETTDENQIENNEILNGLDDVMTKEELKTLNDKLKEIL